MILTLFSTATVQAASIDSNSQNESMVARTNLTFLEGKSGDNHLVYTYQENRQQYKVIEDADSDFMNVYSTIYVMNSDGNYVETKSQALNIQSDGNCRLTSTDIDGNCEISHINTIKSVESVNTSTEVIESRAVRAYTDPGTGEWVTKTWNGSSYIYII